MTDSRAVAAEVQVSLEHPMVPENKKVSWKNSWDKSKVTEASVKEFAMAKWYEQENDSNEPQPQNEYLWVPTEISNWGNSEKEYLLLTDFQLINIERIMEIEKSPFGKYHGNVSYRQESSMDAKITGQKYDEK